MEAITFTDEWSKFVVNLGEVTNERFAELGSPYVDHLSPTLRSVVEAMESRQEEIREMVEAELQEPETAEGLELLYSEFQFFNALAEKGEDTKVILDAGRTIKGSFEAWFEKKPKGKTFWKRLLKILNELLSLAKGAL